jgi:transcriptional regulator with XRE-family HTH domain
MQLTLRAVRISNGYSEDEVSRYCGVDVKTIGESEIDSSEMEYDLLLKITNLYKIALDHIYLGRESDCCYRGNERVTQYY